MPIEVHLRNSIMNAVTMEIKLKLNKDIKNKISQTEFELTE